MCFDGPFRSVDYAKKSPFRIVKRIVPQPWVHPSGFRHWLCPFRGWPQGLLFNISLTAHNFAHC